MASSRAYASSVFTAESDSPDALPPGACPQRSFAAGAYAKTQKHDSACEKLKPRAAQEPPATSSCGGGATDKATGSAMGGATSRSAPPARAAVAARAW